MCDDQSDANLQEHGLPLPGDNWRHYMDAFKILNDFWKSSDTPATQSEPRKASVISVPLDHIVTAPQNTLDPSGGYLCFYSDLLGFSSEMRSGGMDSLPDFYGAAYFAAREHPSVQTYLLSDSFVAFASVDQAGELIALIDFVLASWRSDGMLPQSSIGYGTFVERRPTFGITPSNFFGVQIAGTALVDAVDMHKDKPFGSRILVSPVASHKLESIKAIKIAIDKEGSLEVFCERPLVRQVFDCLYYLMCLRDLQPATRIFNHYVWSTASGFYSGGDSAHKTTMYLCAPSFDRETLDAVYAAVFEVLKAYRPIER